MTILLNLVFKHNPAIVQARSGDNTVMMNQDFTQYFGLEEVGLRVWQLCEQETTLQTVCEQLVNEFDISFEQCLADITPFIKDLLNNNMLVKC